MRDDAFHGARLRAAMLHAMPLAALLAAILLAMMFVAGCDSDRRGRLLQPLLFSGDSGLEPNDTIAEAFDLAVNNTPVPQTLHLPHDVDYFRFAASAGTHYLIRTEEVDAKLRTRIEVRDAADDVLAADAGSSAAAGAALIEWVAPETKAYYVRVSSEGGVGAYSIRITYGPDAYEPDDTPATASAATFGAAGPYHSFHSELDRDYIVFSAWRGFRYRVALEDPDQAAAISVALLDAAGNTLGSNDATQASSFVVAISADGPCYVRTQPWPRFLDPPQTAFDLYRIVITPEDDAWEPDGTIANAKPIATDGTPQRHSLSVAGDEDCVQFAADSGSSYTIRTDSLSRGLDTQIEVLSVAGAALASDTHVGGGSASYLQWTAPASGTYYLRIRSATPGLQGTYVVRVVRE